MGWINYSDSLDQFPLPQKGYAIVMNTWKRYDLLKQSISHYSSCAGLESIHIVWSEPNLPSDSLSEFLNLAVQSKSKGLKKVELSFDINTEDSLNNRFKEIPELKTDAVFSIDDDVIFPCSSVEFAFKVWQSAPDAMVGFVPRAHWVDKSVRYLRLDQLELVAREDTVKEDGDVSIDLLLSMGECLWYPLLSRLWTAAMRGFGDA